MLGLRTVRGVVTAAGMAGSFRRHPAFDHDAFWRHSIGSALCAQALAGELGRDDGDLAFTVGWVFNAAGQTAGKYFTVWQKQNTGEWLYVVD